jgi:cell division septum initiation protein DivIVA
MRLTPAAVRETRLKRAPLGRRGIDEEQVNLFLAEVERELVLLFNERTELQNEVTRLRQRLLHVEQSGAPGSALAVVPNPEDASVQAVKILAKAQQTADEYVSDAEDYSRQLAEDARRHYEEIMSEARERARALVDGSHQRASRAAEAAVGPLAGGGGERGDLESEVAYLRTFSQVYRVHLRSYLEALLRNVDEWERAENVPSPQVPARPAAPQPQGLHGPPAPPGPYPPAQQPVLGSAFRGGQIPQGPAG